VTGQAFSTETDKADDFDQFVGCGERGVGCRAGSIIDRLQHVGVALSLEPIDHAGVGGDIATDLGGCCIRGGHVERLGE
jgi:FAD/FMN-containing dehydrogenase